MAGPEERNGLDRLGLGGSSCAWNGSFHLGTRAMQAMLTMKKIDIAALRKAHDG